MKLLMSSTPQAIDAANTIRAVAGTTRGSFIPYGDDNKLPGLLLDLLFQSSTHQSIVAFKRDCILGSGMSYEGSEEKMKALVKNLSWKEFWKRTAFDLVVFGGFSWQVAWNKSGKEVVGISHQPFQTVRSSDFPDETNPVNTYHIRRDWTTGSSAARIPVFNPETAKVDKVQLYIHKEYNPINDFYPVPGYYSAYNYIKVENELGKFYHNIVVNGTFPSLLVNVTNNLTDEQKEQFVDSFEKTYKGGSNSNKVMVTFSDKDTPSVEVTPIEPVSNDKLFETLNETVCDKIITSHRIPRVLVGMEKNLGLSSNGEELRVSFEYFNNTFAIPAQDTLEEAFGQILEAAGINGEINFLMLDLTSQSFTEETLNKILTQDELRDKIGYSPLPKTQDVEDLKPSQDELDNNGTD